MVSYEEPKPTSSHGHTISTPPYRTVPPEELRLIKQLLHNKGWKDHIAIGRRDGITVTMGTPTPTL